MARVSTADVKKSMTRFLRFLAKDGVPLAKVLLERGRWFAGRADSHDYEVTNAWRKARRPKVKECYYNAQTFCLDRAEGRYFEGYAFSGAKLYVPHAWVVMPDDRVIDFTWEAVDRKLRRNGIACDRTGAVYFGVEVPRKQFCEVSPTPG